MDSSRLIVFSDLDGTLLDHATYDWSPASEALEALRIRKDFLILASSKTASEIMQLRAAVGFEQCPAIVENGSGILPPLGAESTFTDTRAEVLAALSQLPKDLQANFEGFSHMTTGEISRFTGLSVEDAERAADRQFSEPGLWHGSADQRQEFLEQLSARGVSAKQGGRFLTLTLGGTKADRMSEVIRLLDIGDWKTMTVALGDAPNDLEMLEAADVGFLIPNPGHEHFKEQIKLLPSSVKIAQEYGPSGWNRSVLSVIEELENHGETA